jgi:hypothetical protein
MPDVGKGFANNNDDPRISDVQSFVRASVKRESRGRPTKPNTRWLNAILKKSS